MENNYEIIWNEEEHYFFETFEEAEEEYFGEYSYFNSQNLPLE